MFWHGYFLVLRSLLRRVAFFHKQRTRGMTHWRPRRLKKSRKASPAARWTGSGEGTLAFKRAWSPTLNPPPDPVKPRLAEEASAAAAKAATAAATASAATGGEVFLGRRPVRRPQRRPARALSRSTSSKKHDYCGS